MRHTPPHPVPPRTPDDARLWDGVFLIGLFLLSLQFVTFSVAQIGHVWGVVACALLIVQRRLHVGWLEVSALLAFLAVALINTQLVDVAHIKGAQQTVKFAVVYPAFYLIGRFFGRRYLERPLPFGVWIVAGFIAFQWLVQRFELPIVYKPLDFQLDAVHGTFKERNWFAVFVFFVSYILLLKSPGRVRSALVFLGIGVAMTLLSGSKSVLVVCGIVLLLAYRGHAPLKLVAIVVGAAVFIELFAWQLTGEMLRVRLEDERGLAFALSTDLIARDWLGYGFGFVEAHFGAWWVAVQGLGYGTNSVFASPLDLMLIAGPFGLALWSVVFAGVGLGWRTMLLLAPVAVWSLINPLHQSEIVYLMLGYLVSWGQGSGVADNVRDDAVPDDRAAGSASLPIAGARS